MDDSWEIQDILYEISMETEGAVTKDTLRYYLKRFPKYKREIRDFTLELSLDYLASKPEPMFDDIDIDKPSPAVEKAMVRFWRRYKQQVEDALNDIWDNDLIEHVEDEGLYTSYDSEIDTKYPFIDLEYLIEILVENGFHWPDTIAEYLAQYDPHIQESQQFDTG